MFNKIIQLSLKNRVLILLGYLVIALVSLNIVNSMTIDVFPDLNRPNVALIVEAGGLAPDELEKQVTIPIENAINGATNVTRVFSTSNVGFAVIKTEFDWDMDIYLARQIVMERLAQISGTFPAGVKVVMGPVSSIMGEVMMVGLSSPDGTVGGMELRDIADWNITKRLLLVQGVSQVSVIGGDVKEYQVVVDTNKMRLHNISLNMLRTALGNSGENTNGGFMHSGYTEAVVRNFGRVNNIEDIKNTVLPLQTNGTAPAITVDAVASVKTAPRQNKRGTGYINGYDGVIISISKQPSADTIKLTSKIEAELDNIAKSLPDGVVLTKGLFRQSNFIMNAVDNIKDAMIEGSVLIAVILFAFLMNFRTTAIVLVVIPTSFLMTAIVFKLLGLSINTMTLGGLAMAVGSLVDDAIVAVSNCFKRIKENKHLEHPKPNIEVVWEATKEIINSVVFSTVLVLLVFIPLFALSGIEGKIFTPLALAFVLSMFASMIVSITLTPVLSYYFIPGLKVLNKKYGLLVRGLCFVHQKALYFCFRYYKSVLLAVGAAFVAAVIGTFSFGREFLPAFNEGSFNVSLTMIPGTSLEESARISMQAQKNLLEIEDIKSVAGRSGRSDVDEHALGVNVTEFEVDLKEESKRTKDEIVAEMRHSLEFPGVFVNIGQPISHRIDFIISGIRSQIAVKIFGNDLTTLYAEAEKVRDIMSKVKGVADLSIEQQVMIPELHIDIDRKKAKQYGVMVGTVSQDLESGLAGEEVGMLIEDDRFYNIVLRLNSKSQSDIENIANLPIETVNGSFVPLKAIAEIKNSKGPNQISRENGKRRIVVQANVVDRDLVGTVEEIREKLKTELKLPKDYFLTFDGQFETQAKASRDITLLAILSFVLIFVGLYINFKSLNLAAQLMIVLPLSLIGAVGGIALTTKMLSIATIVGFITLIGIAIRNGILLIDLYEKRKQETGGGLTVGNLVFLTSERLVPVMMTTATSILGFIPLIIGGNTAGKEILYPAAVVIASGLLVSTLLNLLLTPILYYYFYEKE